MTITQTLKKTFYPVLLMAGKWLKYNGKHAINKKNNAPSIPIYTLNAYTNQGELVSFHDFKGQYILLTNTASDCGYTAQYAELQQLQERFKGRLTVLAFPANDFGGQEPANDDEIAQFCGSNFGVTFPVMMKSDVKGLDKNEVYQWLTDPAKNGWNSKEPTWNFCKYLINPSGNLIGFFESGISPLDDDIAGRIH
ncbi:MAG: glutathione peroxidase [Chitinophagaceae bacterium]|jgi:glutathione peroxidase|nr:glutathione peroxidase [Chitinophagaceae bacterium]